MTKVLIVEDSARMRTELTILLGQNGYDAEALEYFDQTAEAIVASDADLVLLDLNLPGVDGFHVTREVRKRSSVPIIMVTSRDTEIDEVIGMNLGADDFVTKPYSTQVLLARIASVLRRGDVNHAGDVISCGAFEVDLARSVVRSQGAEAELTRNELRILTELCRSRGSIVPREALMRALWADDVFVDDNTLTVNINRLRSTLDSVGLGDAIVTKRGQGYLLEG